MAGFQTNVFRDGAWHTANVSMQQALDATAGVDASRALNFHTHAPQCGIVTRTVVPSPVAHWILPVRMRSKSRIDVAFIGSHAVHIRELRNDGQLIDIVRKDDFGARICNAVVMGDTPNSPNDIVVGDQASVRLEDAMDLSGGPVQSVPDNKLRKLPPQILVLFLTNGQLAFLFLKGGGTSPWTFEMTQYQTPWAIKNLGFRLAIDPSSRYLAAASSQKAFMIWELEGRAQLEEQYEQFGTFKPLKPKETGGEARSFQGTLFHLEFLFPRPEDVNHVILMMVVARRDSHSGVGASRVLTFDWMAGEDLRTTIQGDFNGIRLPEHYKMPLMIIPLRFKNSLCVVAEHSIGVIRNAISGSLECDDLMTQRPPKTPLHHGKLEPLWAAWARPIRGDWYCKNTDIIILAREDGYLVHIEVDAETVVPTVTSAGSLDSTISTAFAMPYIDDADAIIVGGDSAPGGTWKLSPRTDPVRASTLRNWSPVVEITSAPFTTPRIPKKAADQALNQRPRSEILVSASGRGMHGNLTSFRWGQQARIGTDIDTESVVRRIGAYMTPHDVHKALHIALSLPDSTLILQFSRDMTEVRALDENETTLDLGSCTLAMHNSPNQVVQVTEQTIALVVGGQSYEHSLQFQGITCAEHAICSERHVVISSLTDGGSILYSYTVGPEGITSIGSWLVQGEVTCLKLMPVSLRQKDAVFVASLVDGYPWVSLYDLNGRIVASQAVAIEEAPTTQHEAMGEHLLYETLSSLHTVSRDEDNMDLFMGTVWGRMITASVMLSAGKITIHHTRKLGKSPVKLFAPTEDPLSSDLVATCDEHMIMLAEYCGTSRRHKRDAMIIPTSDDQVAVEGPPIHWVSAVPPELDIGLGLTPVLLLAGSRLLLAELSATPRLVPRSLPVQGTPTKVIYSDMWKCYVVGVIQDGKPTIIFVEPETGATISQPTTPGRVPLSYVSGLGNEGDRILCMDIWSYKKDGQTFPYILVGTQNGQLLTLSARSADPRDLEKSVAPASGSPRVVQYWMRYKRKGNSEKPVWCVIGVEDGMVHCTGTTVYYERLSTEQRKMVEISHFELDSPATTIQAREGRLFVLTSRHSLLILDHQSPRTDAHIGQMTLLHVDSATRSAIHMVPMQVPRPDDPTSTITMVSDASSNVVGLWTAMERNEQPLETVFKASLPVPIRRFIQARCRPPWYEPREHGRYGTVRTTPEDMDTFGVALDGALYHFAIVRPELWELLLFIQYQAEKAGVFRTLSNKEARGEGIEHTRRHIDGDLLGRCLKNRVLEEIVAESDGRGNLFGLLDKIEGGILTEGYRAESKAGEKYFELAYRILAYLDAPVL